MRPVDKSNLSFSLNNNPSCSILEQSKSKRIIFCEKGLFSKDYEILILLNDTYFSSDAQHEIYGHIVKYTDNLWCSCLVFTYKRLNKQLEQQKFLFEYHKQIILLGNWSPMNSISKDDVFIESRSYSEAIENMNKIIKNFSCDNHIPISPSPEDEMNGIDKVQEGIVDFRLLNLYGINLTYTL